MTKISKNEWYMSMARQVAERATCQRAKVGSVLVKDGCVISTGINGNARGEPECIEKGCSLYNNHCVSTIHSELNSIINCARLGVSTVGTTLYCTHRPCDSCARAIINAGISTVYYQKEYKGFGTINLEEYVEVIKL